MAIKITPADTAFSKCVKERADWKCERCGTQYQEGDRGLHCSHGNSHDILTKQGIERSGEWFKCDIETARTAVLEAKAEQDRVEAMVSANRLKAANDGWLAPRAGLASAGSGAGD